MSCYHDAADWFVTGRHHEECEGGECPGCEPCGERHCEDCGKVHVDFGEQVCPKCIARTRRNLRTILDLSAALPQEAEVRGVNSEAAMLNGPAADTEAFAWRRAARAARDGVLLTNLEPDDEQHPVNVLGRWVVALGEDYGDPTSLKMTVSRAVDYLDRRLGRVAHDAGQDWSLFAREVRRCRAHLEVVLHDGEQRDTGAPCMKCNLPLVREWGTYAAADGWRCPKCHEFRSETEYRLNVAELHSENATHLTDVAMEERTGIKAGTIRVWARRDEVEKRLESGRTVYSVADVEKKIQARAS